MCGIAGAVNLDLDAGSVFNFLSHRGPDFTGHYQHRTVCLFHTRLSILDNHGGQQPMQSGDLTICYNGEIYNHQKLRQKHNLNCRNYSDTETLIELLGKSGLDCLSELDGMFAFALHDRKHSKLHLARDRAGQKPLYYWKSGRRFMFSSELNMIAGSTELDIDYGRIAGFLSSGFFPGERTPYKNVFELPPGHVLTLDIEPMTLSLTQWFDIESQFPDTPMQLISDTDYAKQQLQLHLQKSVEGQILNSDHEVGMFLSGGIDSGLVAAIAARVNPDLKTFTVKIDGLQDESRTAGLVARHLGTEHRTIEINLDDLASRVKHIIQNYGEPFIDDSIIPSWYICREARNIVKVALSGDGGDELFAGYTRYIPFKSLNFFYENRFSENLIGLFQDMLPVPKSAQIRYTQFHRLLKVHASKNTSRYLPATWMLEPEYMNTPTVPIELENLAKRLAKSDFHPLSRMLIFDFQMMLGGILLHKMDIASMAHSLEVRNPLLGNDLIEFSARLHPDLKINRLRTKFILREIAGSRLPENIHKLPKRGFGTPLVHWMDTRLEEITMDTLSTADPWVRQFVRPNIWNNLLYNKTSIPAKVRARSLWALLVTEIWYQNYRLLQTGRTDNPTVAA